MPNSPASLYVFRLSHTHLMLSHSGVGTLNHCDKQDLWRDKVATNSSLVGKSTQFRKL